MCAHPPRRLQPYWAVNLTGPYRQSNKCYIGASRTNRSFNPKVLNLALFRDLAHSCRYATRNHRANNQKNQKRVDSRQIRPPVRVSVRCVLPGGWMRNSGASVLDRPHDVGQVCDTAARPAVNRPRDYDTGHARARRAKYLALVLVQLAGFLSSGERTADGDLRQQEGSILVPASPRQRQDLSAHHRSYARGDGRTGDERLAGSRGRARDYRRPAVTVGRPGIEHARSRPLR